MHIPSIWYIIRLQCTNGDNTTRTLCAICRQIQHAKNLEHTFWKIFLKCTEWWEEKKLGQNLILLSHLFVFFDRECCRGWFSAETSRLLVILDAVARVGMNECNLLLLKNKRKIKERQRTGGRALRDARRSTRYVGGWVRENKARCEDGVTCSREPSSSRRDSCSEILERSLHQPAGGAFVCTGWPLLKTKYCGRE